MKTKICTKCKKRKKLNRFYKHKNNKDDYNYWCKNCDKEYNKKYIKSNKKLLSLNAKKYYQLHKKEIIARTKKYRQKNKRKIQKYHKKYYLKNRGEINQSKYKLCNICKKSFIINSNSQKICSEKCRKERNRIYGKKYNSKRKKDDINYKILCNLRIRILRALKKNYKHTLTIKLLGCTIPELKQHLEKQFEYGMFWGNHGRGWYGKKEWHIDHIRPCASFDLSKPEEQKKCFNYKNLRPLWAKENLRKGNKL